jgi:pimeloyl-ACP methyl ester carboxylesterase
MMSRWIKISLAILLVVAVSPVVSVLAQTNEDCDHFGTYSNGALYCITEAPFWNGDLVIFAHGYVAADEPLDIPWSQMTFSDGNGGVITLPLLVNSMGYDFATTSYSVNGLAVQEGIADVLDLIDVFVEQVGTTPNHIYLVGASEGGLVTTLAIERHAEAFTGGFATCGPIGSFRGQVDYWGDFRVVFDYFMDRQGLNVLPGNAMSIPAALMNKWDSVYVPRIGNVLAFDPSNTQQLLSVTKAPVTADPLTIGETTLGILWYNVFATDDAIKKLGGKPYDNRDREYTGSLDDELLNAGVKRYKAQQSALDEIANNYETSGFLQKPLVTMHTTGDPIVPYWHQTEYTAKVLANTPYPALYYWPIEVNAYGHCNFSLQDILDGFGALIYMSTGEILQPPPFLLETNVQAEAFQLAP